METSTKKPHLSHTQLDLLSRCGEAYRRRYVEGERIPPGVAAIRGTAVHDAGEQNFRQKIDSHRDLPADDVKDLAAEAFDHAVNEGVQLTRDERRAGEVRTLNAARDTAIALAELYSKKIAPQYQPVRVEETVRIPLEGATHDLVGVVDLVDDAKRVVDFKTSAKKLSADDAHHSTQLTIYAAAHQVLTGELPSEVRLEVLQAWARPSRKVLVSTRSADDLHVLASRINAGLAVIASGTYLPAPVGAWWCSPKWCGYWATCPYVNGARGRE